jgi:hypothetical protein
MLYAAGSHFCGVYVSTRISMAELCLARHLQKYWRMTKNSASVKFKKFGESVS